MAEYGLDPSLVSYVQGNGMPPTPVPQPVGSPSYGLDPSVVAGLQNGFAVGTAPTPPAPPPPPPPRPALPPSGLAQANDAAGMAGSLLRVGSGLGTGVTGDEIAAPYAPEPEPASVTGGALPPQQPQVPAPAPLVANTPDQVIGTAAALTPKQVAASNKVYAAQQAQAAAFANTPEGIAQKADAEKKAVVEKERQAQADADAAQAAQNDAVAKATAKASADAAAQEKIDAAKRAQDQAATAQYTQQYAQQIKDAADFKVNTKRDIGMGGLIAVALSGIGDAIAHRNGPNAALEIINKRIDQGIADQWAQKRALGEKANETKGLIDVSRQAGVDDRQDQDVAKAAALTDAKNQIANITAQSANPQLKARGEQLQAGLDQQVANLTTDLANRKLEAQKVAAEQAHQRAELGVQYGHLGLARDTLKEQTREHDLQRQDKLDELEKDYVKMGQTALAAKAKELKTSGVFDPNTAAPLIDASNPEAAPALQQARQLDMQAAAAADPAKQAALSKQAAELRNNIQVQYGAVLDDKEGKLKKQLGGAQRLINVTQRIRDALEDGSITDRDTRAGLKTDATNAFTDWAEANDVKASSREHEVYAEAIGALDGVGSTNVNKGPLKASLDALDRGTQDLAGGILHSHGIKPVDENGNPWILKPQKPPEDTKLSGTTSAEAADNAQPGAAAGLNPVGEQGFAARAGRAASRAVFGGEEPDPVLVAENSAATGPTGLTKEDDSKVLGLIKTYGHVSPDENQRVVSSLLHLVGDPGDDERKQALANSVITRVRGESPILYKKMLDALPAERRKEITQFQVLDPSIVNGMGWNRK